MGVLWMSYDEEESKPEPNHFRHPNQLQMPFRSTCCNAPMEAHWPCDEYGATLCTACGQCMICITPNGNAEAQAIQEWERTKERKRR